MKVYVLTEGYSYEGDTVIGVFSELEPAKAHAAEAKRGRSSSVYWDIYLVEVGHPEQEPLLVWNSRTE